ncbi:MAG TPA: hypothetical protein VIC28_13515 [Thermoanaerobaculia bacterium]
MKRTAISVLPALLFLAVGCAPSAPPSTPPPPFPAAELEAPVEDAALLCNASARVTSWKSIKVPENYRAVDVALTPDRVWVLLAPPALVSLPREGEVGQPMFSVPRGEADWSAIDTDPVDGSLWIASSNAYRLVHVSPDGNQQRIDLKRVQGEGGLRQLRMGRDRIYGVPVCADEALWIFNREGELVDYTFEAAERMADLDTARTVNMGYACPTVFMARGEAGEVMALNPQDVKLYRAGEGKKWDVVGGPWELEPPGRYTDIADLRKVKLEGVGDAYYLPDLVNRLFLYRGSPVLLGGGVSERHNFRGTLLYRVEGNTLTPVVEVCGRQMLIDVESDGKGYAAITPRDLVVGRFAG